jgi:hypothetical protein
LLATGRLIGEGFDHPPPPVLPWLRIKPLADAGDYPGKKEIDDALRLIKPRCIVNAAKLAGSAYLETPDDIEKFLRELRQRLEEAIKTGKRVQIR